MAIDAAAVRAVPTGKVPRGVLPALVTPMKEESVGAEPAVDYEALKELVERQVAAGMDGLVILGSTGEAATMADSEWTAVAKAGIAAAAGRIPVVLGTGSNCTRVAAERTKLAAALGAAAAMVVCPYYLKPTQEGLQQHFSMVAAAAGSLPIILYNVPGRTAVDLLPETAAAVAAKYPNVMAIKECSGAPSRLAALKKLLPHYFVVYTGEDGEACEALLSRAVDGAITVAGQVAAPQFAAMCHFAMAGKVRSASPRRLSAVCRAAGGDCLLPGAGRQATAARQLQAQLQPLVAAAFVESNPIPVKYALWHQGTIASPALRLPLTCLSKVHRPTVEAAVAAATAGEPQRHAYLVVPPSLNTG